VCVCQFHHFHYVYWTLTSNREVESVPLGYHCENDLSATEHFMTNQFIETNEKPHSHGDKSTEG
jgi:hypothetical protein